MKRSLDFLKTPKQRSGVIPAAQMRRGGPMRDKRMKRAEENKHPDYHEEMEEIPFEGETLGEFRARTGKSGSTTYIAETTVWRNGAWQKSLKEPTREVTCSWLTVHHAIEMLQMQAEKWHASADAWKTLNELRESIGMKKLQPIDFPKWPEYFDA